MGASNGPSWDREPTTDVTRWRYVTPTTRGRWCDTRQAAEDSAVKAGEGYREPWAKGRFYPSVLTKIEDGK